MNSFDFFDSIFCINLPERVDRLVVCEELFQNYNIKVDFVDGVRCNATNSRLYNAYIGTSLAHANCIELAQLRGSKNVLIFEDDVEFFYDYPHMMEYLRKAIDDLPSAWGMLYLGVNVDAFPPYEYSDHLARLTGGYSLHAYAINSRLFDPILRGLRDIKNVYGDVWISEHILKNELCFVVNPLLAGQRSSYSDIQGMTVNYSQMMKDRFKASLRP